MIRYSQKFKNKKVRDGCMNKGGHDAVLYGNRLISALNLKKREFFSDEYA